MKLKIEREQNAPGYSDTRYTAEWIAAQHHDENGEWEPDRDEYVGRACKSLADAKRLAVVESKRCNVVEWCRVTVEQFNPSLGIPRRSDAAWDTVAVHYGDWDGNWQEERCEA